MTNNEIVKIIEMLLNNDKECNLKDYSVKELEEMSIYLYKNNEKYPMKDIRNILMQTLSKRKNKLDASFVWSEENRQKFLKINNELTKVFQSTYNEATALLEKLKDKLRNNDPFIKDYEIELQITPYAWEENSTLDGFSFTNVLCEPLNHYAPISHSFSHSIEKDPPLFLDRSLNWNIEILEDVFPDDVYIGYSIHALMDEDWSLYDIINIYSIWADVKVLHQYFTEF